MTEQDFKDKVKQYIAIADQLAALGKDIREIRKRQGELREEIIKFMKVNDIVECQLQDGKLVRKQCKRLEPLKKEHILGELAKAVGDAQAENLLVGIFSKRGVTEKDTLSRTRARTAA